MSDETTKVFYDIINNNDWEELDEESYGFEEQPINKSREVFLGSYLVPTPFPGLWLNFNIGFEVEEGNEDSLW